MVVPGHRFARVKRERVLLDPLTIVGLRDRRRHEPSGVAFSARPIARANNRIEIGSWRLRFMNPPSDGTCTCDGGLEERLPDGKARRHCISGQGKRASPAVAKVCPRTRAAKVDATKPGEPGTSAVPPVTSRSSPLEVARQQAFSKAGFADGPGAEFVPVTSAFDRGSSGFVTCHAKRPRRAYTFATIPFQESRNCPSLGQRAATRDRTTPWQDVLRSWGSRRRSCSDSWRCARLLRCG